MFQRQTLLKRKTYVLLILIGLYAQPFFEYFAIKKTLALRLGVGLFPLLVVYTIAWIARYRQDGIPFRAGSYIRDTEQNRGSRQTWFNLQSPKKIRISHPPCSFLWWFADFFCSKKTQRQITNPIIAQIRYEHSEALLEKRKVKAEWIHLRGYWEFFSALGLHRLLKTFARLFKKAG